MQIPTFGFLSLTESVNKMIRPQRFLMNLLFGRIFRHATTSVQVDIIVGKRRVAPFVRRGKEAVVMNNLGKKSQIIEPPNIRMKKSLKPSEILFQRGAGMSVHVAGGTGDSVEAARRQKIAQEQADLKDTGMRTVEYLCAQALKGSYSITGEDVAFAIDFQMPADNKPALTSTAKWDQPTTATPLKNARNWGVLVKKASGKIITDAIMTTETWNKFINTDEVKAYLDKRNIDLGEIKTDSNILQMGAKKMAELEGISYWTYDEYYEDDSGTLTAMIPDGVVSYVSRAADNRMHYAAIEDLKAGTVIGEWFSKDWTTEDPSEYWLLVEGHPLPVTHEPEAQIYATVY